MLNHNNLEEFQDPVNYDIEIATEGAKGPSLAFYLALAQEWGGPVLDLACGTGLVALPLAQLGLEVTGVDIARCMLAYAQQKAQDLSIQWVEADARTLDLQRQFRFVLLTGNAFQAFLRREDQVALLATVHRHLAADGIFAFETRNPTGTDLTTRLAETEWMTYTNAAGHQVRITETQLYDPATAVLHWTLYRRWMEAGHMQTQVSRIACRFTDPQALNSLLYEQGFQILRQYGDWVQGPLTATSPTIVSVCQKR